MVSGKRPASTNAGLGPIGTIAIFVRAASRTIALRRRMDRREKRVDPIARQRIGGIGERAADYRTQ